MSLRTKGGNGFRRMAALSCLLSFSLGPAQFFPGLFALAAGVEGSHSVLISTCADGGTKVSLKHLQRGASVDGALVVTHRHGWGSKLVCLVADSPPRAGDHVASFASGGLVEDAQKRVRIQPCSLAVQKPGLARVIIQALNWSALFLSPHRSAGFPTQPDSKLVGLRHERWTCLLL